MQVQSIILAAGKGTRMGNPELPKVLAPLSGKPMVSYILDSLATTSFLPPVLVVGFHHEKVRQALGDSYRYILQPELLGTGYAEICCQKELQGQADYFLVINGDQPLISRATIENLVAAHTQSGAVMSLVTITSSQETFQAFGRIVRDADGKVTAIREFKDATEEERQIKEFNAGVYCFSNDFLWPALGQLDSKNSQAEYYLTDLLAAAIQEGLVVSTAELADWKEGLGVNSPDQLEAVEKQLAN